MSATSRHGIPSTRYGGLWPRQMVFVMLLVAIVLAGHLVTDVLCGMQVPGMHKCIESPAGNPGQTRAAAIHAGFVLPLMLTVEGAFAFVFRLIFREPPTTSTPLQPLFHPPTPVIFA